MRTSVERVRQENTYVTDNTYVCGRRTSSENAYVTGTRSQYAYVVVIIYVHQIAYAIGNTDARQKNTCVAESRTQGNAYVAENTYITGRCTSSKCTYARKVRTSSISRYVSRISVTENVVGISLTESTVGTRLFAQTSNGPKCSRMLPKQYHFETLK